MLEIDWHTGVPTVVGTYIVAAEYAPGTGMYEITDWDGEKWDCHPSIKVVAYLAWDDFMKQLNLKWPGELPEPPPRQRLSESDTAYEEV